MRIYLYFALIILFLLAVSCETAQNEKPLCNKKIDCKDGRTFPAESYNEETGKCEPLMFAGGTPCFNEYDPQ